MYSNIYSFISLSVFYLLIFWFHIYFVMFFITINILYFTFVPHIYSYISIFEYIRILLDEDRIGPIVLATMLATAIIANFSINLYDVSTGVPV